MSLLNILLLIALIAVFILIIWDDKRKWETIYERTIDKSQDVQIRHSYLKQQGIHCRLKNYTPGSIRMIGMQGGQMSKQASIQLQVHKKEADQARRYLAAFDQ